MTHTPDDPVRVPEILWPDRREDLVNALRVLSDVDHQASWSTADAAPPSLTDAVHWLVDDTGLDVGAASDLIPEMLRDQSEATAVDGAVRALMLILVDLGATRPDRDYLEHPNWPDVVTTSTAALNVLGK